MFALILTLFLPSGLSAQLDDHIDIVIMLDPLLQHAQTLSIAHLGMHRDGSGPHLFDLIAIRQSTRELSGVCLAISVTNSKGEELIAVTTSPFSIPEGLTQFIADNNDIASGNVQGLPNFTASIDLTDFGESLISDSEGDPTLPTDIYTVHISTYYCQESNDLLGETSVQIGGTALSNPIDFTLVSPGDALGSGAMIETIRPFFNWDGNASSYRLILVSSHGEEIEAVIANALLTPPDSETHSDEMIDLSISESSFSYPASGAEPLIPGQTYCWQIFGESISPHGGIEFVPGEIWEFTISEDISMEEQPEDFEIHDCLIQILGPDFVERFGLQGYNLHSLESGEENGQSISSRALPQETLELCSQIAQGKLAIIQSTLAP